MTPSVGLPFFLMLLITSVPQLPNVAQYVVTEVAGWSYAALSFNWLIFGVGYFFLLGFFINGL